MAHVIKMVLGQVGRLLDPQVHLLSLRGNGFFLTYKIVYTLMCLCDSLMIFDSNMDTCLSVNINIYIIILIICVYL